MENQIADSALKTLQREANRISAKKPREALLKKVKSLREAFEAADSEPCDNPPGKAVIRGKNGKAIALQG